MGEIAIGIQNASLFNEAVRHSEELDKTVSELHIEVTEHKQSKLSLERSHQRLHAHHDGNWRGQAAPVLTWTAAPPAPGVSTTGRIPPLPPR